MNPRGDNDHVHPLVRYPPKAAVPALVNSLEGVPPRRMPFGGHRPGEPAYQAWALPVAVLLRGVLRWRAAEHHRHYIEQQNDTGYRASWLTPP